MRWRKSGIGIDEREKKGDDWKELRPGSRDGRDHDVGNRVGNRRMIDAHENCSEERGMGPMKIRRKHYSTLDPIFKL